MLECNLIEDALKLMVLGSRYCLPCLFPGNVSASSISCQMWQKQETKSLYDGIQSELFRDGM